KELQREESGLLYVDRASPGRQHLKVILRDLLPTKSLSPGTFFTPVILRYLHRVISEMADSDQNCKFLDERIKDT
ncbi:hypothetical protein Tco_0548372, partial [Tanacetum coccineum]